MAGPTRQQVMQYRRFVSIASAFVGGGIFLVKGWPHFFPESHRKIHEDKTKQVPEHYYKILHETAARMKLDHPEKIKLFISRDQPLTHAGAPYMPNGGVIGLPPNCVYQSKEDIKNTLKFREQTLNWNTKGGRLLLDNLLMSDANVAFMLAHEMERMKRFDYIVSVVSAPCWFFAAMELVKRVAKKQINKKNPMRLDAVFVVVSSFSFICYYFFNNGLEYHYQQKADEGASRCGSHIGRAGLDYIVKRMKVNQVIRVLTEDEDEKYIKANGDEKHSPEIALSVRLGRLDHMVCVQTEKEDMYKSMLDRDPTES